MILYLNDSPARRHFKLLLGQANHLLITILVGLHAIEEGAVTECPEELHAVWNPKDRVKSARRSRKMVLEMALVRAVDALDTYISWSRRKPHLFQDAELQNSIDNSGRSVLKKFISVQAHYPKLNKVLSALTEVTIAWRNRSVHSLADNEVSEDRWELLRDSADWIAKEFRGLSIHRLKEDFGDQNPPTFKETASLIHTVHETVQELEKVQFEQLDGEQYLKELVYAGLHSDDRATTDERQRQRKIHIGRLWGDQDIAKRESKLSSFLKNLGLTETKKYPYAVIFEQSLLKKIVELSPAAAYDYFC